MADEETNLDKVKLDLSGTSSDRAEAMLQHILQTDAPQSNVPEEKKMTVEEAIAARPVLEQDTGRTKVRVLFVTTDENVLLPSSGIRNEYMELAKELDELHVFCLVPRSGSESFDRAATNTWFYQIRAKHWWGLPWAARTAAVEALTWNNSIRPDIIVGVDPFEAGLGAYLISRKFSRPLQYHIYTDPFMPNFKVAAEGNKWRLRIAKFLLKRARSARVTTTMLKDSLMKRYRKLKDIAVIPRFYNFSGIASATPTLDLHEKFRDFAFVMIAFGPMTANSPLHDLFAALHRLLKNPRIGLVVIGEGPARDLFTEKVKLLGIQKNVVFQRQADDLASYLKTADLMVEMDAGEDAEVRVLQAAAAGLPMVVVATDLRRDLFKDGESAFLVEPGDLQGVSEKVSKVVNTTSYRQKFKENAADIVRDRVHEDVRAHYQAAALTIESVLVRSEN